MVTIAGRIFLRRKLNSFWDSGRGFGQYEVTFRKNDVHEWDLRALTAEDLKELSGGARGQRRRSPIVSTLLPLHNLSVKKNRTRQRRASA